MISAEPNLLLPLQPDGTAGEMLLVGPDAAGGEIVIGLVNNMQPTAARRTEEQFARLLQDASTGLVVRLRCFAVRPKPGGYCEDISALWASELDGLIVTGAEPQALRIVDEPLWPLLSRLTEWATTNTRSAIFSCLSAHAAVYRLSGVARCRLPRKLSGVYSCVQAAAHPWMAGAPPMWPVVHSRHNDVPVGALQRAGYRVLSTGPGLTAHDGADSFTCAAGRSQFLMLQGHPEYGADSLLQEYRRDIRRYLQGERPSWPALPVRYFDDATEAALTRLEQGASGRPMADVLSDFAAQVSTLPTPSWQQRGSALFANWVASLAELRASGLARLALAVS